MGYDTKLEERLTKLIAHRQDFHVQKMFGGVGFLMRGNMCFGIWKDELILRLNPEQAQKELKRKNVKPFDITGRPMKGWILVEPQGMKTEQALKDWVEKAMEFVSTLPRKG